jgi:hypothetical protein
MHFRYAGLDSAEICAASTIALRGNRSAEALQISANRPIIHCVETSCHTIRHGLKMHS